MLPSQLTVGELGERLGVSPINVIKGLMRNGIMATINQTLDFDTAAIVAADLGVEVVEEGAEPEPEPVVEYIAPLYEPEPPMPEVSLVEAEVEDVTEPVLSPRKRRKRQSKPQESPRFPSRWLRSRKKAPLRRRCLKGRG